MSARIGRRTLLRGLGGAALALPLLPSLSARAEGGVFPRRFVVLYHPNGVLPGDWFPTPGASETQFTLSPSLSPLAPFQDRLLITKGLHLTCGAVGPGEPHQTGMGGVLTGWHLNPGDMVGGDGSTAGWAKGISLDQRLAQHIGATTRLGSLLLGVRPRGGDVRHHLSYAGDSLPLPVIADPKVAWQTLFEDFNQTDPALLAQRARRGSVLDAVRGQLGALSHTLPAKERTQLDRHLTLLRDLELRLAATPSGDLCDRLPEPEDLEPDSAATMERVTELHIDHLAMALTCDLTRVAALQFGQADNHLTFPWLDSNLDGHALSHMGNNDPNKPQVAKRDHWFAQQVARLLARLDAVPEGDGTLLDHTLLLWVNDIAVGNTHTQKNMPFVLAGGGAGFRMGRYVQFKDASHIDLLLAILRAFGVEDPTFGNPDYQTGPLAGLT